MGMLHTNNKFNYGCWRLKQTVNIS